MQLRSRHDFAIKAEESLWDRSLSCTTAQGTNQLIILQTVAYQPYENSNDH